MSHAVVLSRRYVRVDVEEKPALVLTYETERDAELVAEALRKAQPVGYLGVEVMPSLSVLDTQIKPNTVLLELSMSNTKHVNKTKSDAVRRVMLSKVGSCVEPTEEYLVALKRQLFKWLDEIKEYEQM